MKITVVGLGSGDISSISLKAYEILTESKGILLRTEKHPVVKELVLKGMNYSSFDYIYNTTDDFDNCYDIISDLVIEKSSIQNVVYAVPGHPSVAEKSVKMLIQKCKKLDIEIEVVSSTSFLDDMFVFLELDPSEGFMLIDALDFNPDKIGYGNNIVFTQVYDKETASEVKIKLLDILEDDTKVVVFKAAGIKKLENKVSLNLYEIDQSGFDFDHLTSIFIPAPYNLKHKSLKDFEKIITQLRGPDGCPWDREQNSLSLVPHLIEEADELAEAIKNDDIDNIIEELGDVLLHIMFQCQIGKEEELFDINDVIDGISQKIIRRHPHVFGDETAFTEEDVNIIWERVKKQEKSGK